MTTVAEITSPQDPRAVQALLTIAAACDEHDEVATLNEQTLLRLKHQGLADSRLWLAQDGDAIGFALVHDTSLDLAVTPSARRHGAGGALAASALHEMTTVDAWSHADHPGAARLAARHGLVRVRELRVMGRPASVALPVITPPAGVVVRTYEPTDLDAVLAVNAAAFAHHAEQGQMTASDFADREREAWFDPEGLFLAVRADAPTPLPPADLLGFHWTKVHTDTVHPLGEVYVVAVAPDAAGRGLGTLLTNIGLHHLATRGVAEVILYVDGDNPAAITVYERLGFHTARTEAQYARHPV